VTAILDRLYANLPDRTVLADGTVVPITHSDKIALSQAMYFNIKSRELNTEARMDFVAPLIVVDIPQVTIPGPNIWEDWVYMAQPMVGPPSPDLWLVLPTLTPEQEREEDQRRQARAMSLIAALQGGSYNEPGKMIPGDPTGPADLQKALAVGQ